MTYIQLFYCVFAFWIVFASIVTFALCGWDKRAAKRPRQRRIPEKTLFLWALLGGSIGLWLGMQHFRHKTKHWYFVWGVPAIFVLQAALIVFLLLSFPLHL